jgi:hypothetical protein
MTQHRSISPKARLGSLGGVEARRPFNRLNRPFRVIGAIVLAALIGLVIPAALAGPAVAASGKADVYIVHGLAGRVLDIYVDSKLVLAKADPKAIVGPLRLDSGSHRVALRNGDKTVVQAAFKVVAGQSVDVVAHLRSDSSMAPTVTTYRNDLSAVGPGKLRLSVAHTAAAPPADIRVNGDVLFSNVANGEALTLVVPAATYRVDIVPAATDGAAILGPVELALKKGTLTRVFAIGNVATGSMDAVVHSLKVKTSGASAPRSVPTGNGGQAAQEFVTDRSRTAEVMLAAAIGLFAAAALITVTGRRMRRRVTL